jgi:hypothetical protein
MATRFHSGFACLAQAVLSTRSNRPRTCRMLPAHGEPFAFSVKRAGLAVSTLVWGD